MFDRKDVVDVAVKPPQMTSTGKSLQDQLLDEEKTDLRWLGVNKPSPAKFSLLFLFPAYTKYSA